MQIHHLPVTRTARYCTLGELSSATKTVWFVLHGQGQLAPYFIRKFEPLLDESTFIVAPEALSRYYLDGFGGRVGAGWMTREERISEIDDYVNYLDALYRHLLSEVEPLEINLLGFSQGTATVCRWLAAGAIHCDRLVLWAGYFSGGLTDVIPPTLLADRDVTLVYGQTDEFLRQLPQFPLAYEAEFRRDLPHLRVETFEGGHVIDAGALLRVVGKKSGAVEK